MGKILAIIPARGGSKGIPRKNIIDISGKPLIEYSICTGLEALNKGIINKLVVSTDDNEIAEISKRLGADVPFIRPNNLSGDKSKSVDVLIHAYKFFESQGEHYDSILLLQPTSPLRTCEDIENALRIFSDGNYDSLISAYKEEYICDLVTYHKDGDKAIPLNPMHNQGIRRQELDDVYVRNGAIYISKADFILENHLVFGGKIGMYVMPQARSVNIDCMEDVDRLRWILSK